jgi:hypothetical protein
MAHPQPSVAAAIGSAAPKENSQAHTLPPHTALAAMPGSVVVGGVAAIAAVGAVLVVVVAQVGLAVGLGMVNFDMFVVEREARGDFAVAERGCTSAAKAALVAGKAAMVVVDCYRRSSSLHSRHRILSMGELAEDMIVEQGIVGSRLGAGVEAMVVGKWCWVAVAEISWGMAAMVVALEDTDHGIVQGLDMAVAVLVGSRLRNAIAVYRMGPTELRYLCNSFRLPVH